MWGTVVLGAWDCPSGGGLTDFMMMKIMSVIILTIRISEFRKWSREHAHQKHSKQQATIAVGKVVDNSMKVN